MQTPHRSRTIALLFLVSGLVAVAAAFLLPDKGQERWAHAILFIYGATAILFGGGTAIVRHFDARAKEALARGEDIIARWRVEPAAWAHFVANDRQWGDEPDALPNELALSLPEAVPEEGIEIIIGKTAVQIGQSIHRLPRRGTPEITDAILHEDGPGIVELRLYYPGGGHGASGVPYPPRRAALRFPVGQGFGREAGGVVAHFRGDLGGEPDFFHGKGDGSDPEDVSKCYHCGHETDRYLSHCPQCGGSMQSRRWSRRFGIGLIACGVIITGTMSVILYLVGPKLLGLSFSPTELGLSGTPRQGRMALAILSTVEFFGLTVLGYGIFQVITGRRSKRVIYFAIGLCALILLLAVLL